jgi:hypothetical protein
LAAGVARADNKWKPAEKVTDDEIKVIDETGALLQDSSAKPLKKILGRWLGSAVR